MTDEEHDRLKAAIDALPTGERTLIVRTLVQQFEALEEGQAVNVLYETGAYAGIVHEVRSYGIRFKDRSWASFATGDGVTLAKFNAASHDVARHTVTAIEIAQ